MIVNVSRRKLSLGAPVSQNSAQKTQIQAQNMVGSSPRWTANKGWLYFTVLTFQVTIHEFGAAWNRRNSKKALSVCALFCVRGHSEVCILN